MSQHRLQKHSLQLQHNGMLFPGGLLQAHVGCLHSSLMAWSPVSESVVRPDRADCTSLRGILTQ